MFAMSRWAIGAFFEMEVARSNASFQSAIPSPKHFPLNVTSACVIHQQKHAFMTSTTTKKQK